MRTLNQAAREPKLDAQAAFTSFHLAAIGFVIVSREVKQAMENQHFDFHRERVALIFSLTPRNWNRHG